MGLTWDPPQTGEQLADFLERTGASLRRREVLENWTRAALDRGLAEGAVDRILPGIYCHRDHRDAADAMAQAVSKWLPGALVTGPLALALLTPSLPTPRTAHVVVPYGSHPKAPEWVRVLQRGEITSSTLIRGVPCTVPERALLDAWCAAPRELRTDLLYRALWEKVCTWRQVRREMARMPRVRGRRELEALLDWFDRGATSPLEVRARRHVFSGEAFRDLQWQMPIAVSDRTVIADAVHPDAKVVIELDGRAFHSARIEYDRHRDVELAAAGYITVRLSWDDVVHRPAWCRRQVTEIIATRLRPVRT